MPRVASGPTGSRESDDDRTGEGDRAAGQQPPGESLAQEEPAEDRDEDRADVDQHGGRAGVHLVLRGIERQAVERLPEDATGDDRRDRAPRRHGRAADQDHQPEGQAADQQTAEGQGGRRQVGRDRTDPDECRGP
jgi:hypothetical protein